MKLHNVEYYVKYNRTGYDDVFLDGPYNTYEDAADAKALIDATVKLACNLEIYEKVELYRSVG